MSEGQACGTGECADNYVCELIECAEIFEMVAYVCDSGILQEIDFPPLAGVEYACRRQAEHIKSILFSY